MEQYIITLTDNELAELLDIVIYHRAKLKKSVEASKVLELKGLLAHDTPILTLYDGIVQKLEEVKQ